MKIIKYCAIVLGTAVLCMWKAHAEQGIALNNISDTRLDLFLYAQGEEYPAGFRLPSLTTQFAPRGKTLSWVQVEAKVTPNFSSKGFVAGKTIREITFRPGRIKITYTDGTVDDQAPQTSNL